MYQIPPTGPARWRLQVSIRFEKMVVVDDLDHCDLNMEDKILLESESETVRTVIWATLLRSFAIKISKLSWRQEWDERNQSRTMFQCGSQSACLLLRMIQEKRKNWWKEATHHSQNREDPGHLGEAGFRHSRPFITRKKAKGMSQAEATAGLATHWGKYKAVLFWLFCEIKARSSTGSDYPSANIYFPQQLHLRSVLVLSHVWLFVIPWAVACQAPLSMEFLEWVAIPFSRGSSWPRDQTWVSHIGRWILYHLSHQGSPLIWGIDFPITLWLTLANATWVNVRWTEHWNDLAQLDLISSLLPLLWKKCFLVLWNKKRDMEWATKLIQRLVGAITDSHCCVPWGLCTHLLYSKNGLKQKDISSFNEGGESMK